MTKEEAISALGKGSKVRHRYFDHYGYVYVGEANYLYDEAGNILDSNLFWDLRKGKAWDEDWSIVGS
jgi:hypothetical protein